MAGVSTIGTGGDYATIAAWETAVNTASLTGVEEGLLLGEEFPEAVLIDGGASTPTDYVHLTAASGAEFDSVTRTGARITQVGVSAYVDIVHVKDFHVRLGGPSTGNSDGPGRIGISGNVAAGSGAGISGVRFRYADQSIVTNVHVYDLSSEDVTTAFRDDGSSAAQLLCVSCVASGIAAVGATGIDSLGFSSGGSPDLTCRYCVADDIRVDNAGGDDAVGFSGILAAQNCWASRCVSAAAGNTGVVSQGYYAVGTIDTCAGDDATASPGLQNLDPTAQFVSLTAGAEDYHLLATSALIGAANDAYGVLVDIDGPTTARTDIGADEYQDAGGGPTLVSATDGGALSASGVAGVSGVVTATDAATAALADGAGINGTIAAGDVAGLTVADAPELLALVASADGSTLSTTELVDLAAAIGVSDGAALSLLDGVALLSVVVSLADAASVSATEAAAAISGTVTAADEALVALADAASVYLPLASSDGATLAVADAARGIALAMQMSDALSVSVADAATVAALLARSDSAATSLADLAAITGTVSAADAATITAAEQARINGVLTALDAVAATVTDEAQRQAIGRIVARLVGRWRIYPTLRAEQIGVSDGPSDR